MSSLTTQVFGVPQPGWYWNYYIINNIQELVTALTQDHPVVLMFWADWSEPSKVMMHPYWDMAVAKKDEAVFCRLDFDKFKDVVEKFRVKALPTFLLIKEGEEQRRVVGTKVEELNTTIKNNI
ncbi:unnamed protein product [Urochloa decumbens]|uniref:Thioredoxin domain-containing protein n=1 Tax=Urochloa decumbens TaxID=240449 RepID=A0ABC9AT64_9POAL